MQSGNTGATIVCFSDAEAKRVYALSKLYEVVIPPPISIDRLPQNTRGSKKGRFIVDNADLCLERIMQSPIEMITLTGSPRTAFKANLQQLKGR